MAWLFELHKTQPIAHAVGVLTTALRGGKRSSSEKREGGDG